MSATLFYVPLKTKHIHKAYKQANKKCYQLNYEASLIVSLIPISEILRYENQSKTKPKKTNLGLRVDGKTVDDFTISRN